LEGELECVHVKTVSVTLAHVARKLR